MGVNPHDPQAAWDSCSRREKALKDRREAVEQARAQANAPETIPATGRHHRKDGR